MANEMYFELLSYGAPTKEDWAGYLLQNFSQKFKSNNFNETMDRAVPETFRTVQLVLNFVLCFMVIFGNIVTIIAVARFKFLRTPTNNLAISLASANLLMGFVIPTYNLFNNSDVFKHGIYRYPRTCAILLYFVIVSAGTSLFTLTAIAVDRYIAVLHPLRYKDIVLKSRIRITIVIIWTYTLGLSVVCFVTYGKNTGAIHDSSCTLMNMFPALFFYAFFVPHLTIPAIVNNILYMRILCVARQQQRKIDMELRHITNPKFNKNEAKAAKMMALILLLFFLCWVPYIAINIILRIIGPTAPMGIYMALEIAKLFSLFNSVMNPIVYFWWNRDFRDAFRTVVSCQKVKSSQHRRETITTLYSDNEVSKTSSQDS